MLNRLRHRLGYLTFLLLFLPSLVITSVGEARAQPIEHVEQPGLK